MSDSPPSGGPGAQHPQSTRRPGSSTAAVHGDRLGNPTVDGVAAKVAALEGAQEAVAFASGMAAITTTNTSHLGRRREEREAIGILYGTLRRSR